MVSSDLWLTVTVILSSTRGYIDRHVEKDKRDQQIVIYKKWGMNVVEEENDKYWGDKGLKIVPVEKKMKLTELTNMIRDFTDNFSSGVVIEVLPRKNTLYGYDVRNLDRQNYVDDAIANEMVWEIDIYDDYRE